MQNKNLLELLETYIDLTEKQDEIINKLSLMLRDYARELQHLRNLQGFFDENSKRTDQLLDTCIENYNSIKNNVKS